jgi:hypothetical protein
MLDLIRSAWSNRYLIGGGLVFVGLVRATGSFAVAFALFVTGAGMGLLWWARKRQDQQVREGMRPSPLWRLSWDLSREEARRAALTARWGRACAGLNLTARKTTPNLYQLRRTPAGDIAGVISSKSGVPVSDVAAKAGKLAEVIGCREVVVEPTVDGKATIEFRWSDYLAQVVLPRDLTAPPKGCISLGVLDSGQPFTIPVLNADGEAIFTPILFGGVSGSGKSSMSHAFIGGMIRAGIPVRLWLLDGAGGSELAAYEPWAGVQGDNPAFSVAQYSDDPKKFPELVKEFEAEMRERMTGMKDRGVRLHKPTVEDPFNFLLVDEWTSLPTSLQKLHSTTHTILAQGRKAAFSVVASTQLSEKANIELRELFVRRICLATMTQEQTTTILGNAGGVAALAPAHNIPENQPGVFYMIATGRKVNKGRVAYYDNAAVAAIAQGVLPAGLEEHKPAKVEPCAVYRLYSWNAATQSRELEYVGKALDVDSRFAGHRREAAQDPEKRAWWDEVQRFRQMEEGREDGPTPWLQVAWFASEAEALDAEESAIEAEWPKRNDLHNGPSNPLRRRARRVKVAA